MRIIMLFKFRYLSSNFAKVISFVEVLNSAKLTGGAAFVLAALATATAHAQSSLRASTPPVEYAPFEVVVQTSRSYCFDAAFPIFGDVQYSGATLSVVLTHLISPLQRRGVAATCSQERRFMLPGLPRGRQTIKVDVTESVADANNAQGSRVSETVTGAIDVAPLSATASLVNFWTGLFSPGAVLGEGGIRLTSSRFSMFAGGWDWLEVGDPATGYTFKALSFAAADRLPDALTPLYFVRYPVAFPGGFWTVDKAVAQRLAGEWGSQVSETLSAVGRLNDGACPIGMSPVYQAFHKQAISHRWTQSRAAYSALRANGYAGEGATWCAPALRGE
jgi:hypothetical protein